MLAELIAAQIKAHGWWSRSPLIRKSGLSQPLISKILRQEIVPITVDTARAKRLLKKVSSAASSGWARAAAP